MFEKIRLLLFRSLSNHYLTTATLIAIPSAFIADVFGEPIGYEIASIIFILLVIYSFIDEWKKSKIYTQKSIHLPIVFNISNPASSKSALNAIFDILEKDYPNHKDNLQKYLNIVESDLIFDYKGDIFNEEMFIDFLKITKHDIKQLQNKILKDTHLHIVYIGPIGNAIAIGTILGTEGITLYQYNKSNDSYNISLSIEDRGYKESVKEFKVLKKELIGEIKEGDVITIAIDLSSHNVSLNALEKPIIHLESTKGATLKTSDDFIQASREIYTIINELQQTNNNHIKLTYSMPTTVGIVLGMSIQTYWDIELTQYYQGEYRTLIESLNKIHYYF